MDNTKPSSFTASDELASELLNLGFTECVESIPELRKFMLGISSLCVWVDQSFGLIDIVTSGSFNHSFKELPATALEYLAANGLGTATKKQTFLALAQAQPHLTTLDRSTRARQPVRMLTSSLAGATQCNRSTRARQARPTQQ